MWTAKAQNRLRNNERPGQTLEHNYVSKEGSEQTSEHMWTEKALTRLRTICGQRRPRTDYGTYVEREGQYQTSDHMWTTKAQNKIRNICGQRKTRT